MRRAASAAWAGTVLLLAAGCATGPLQENPLLVGPPRPPAPAENPVYVPHGPLSYNLVFSKVLDIVDDVFPDIAFANRYTGYIETHPRIAPGMLEPWKPGSPDCYQRLLATLQTIRLRCVVMIQAADDGGFFVDVKVYRELEDLPQPVRQTAGGAIFRSDPPIDRQYEVVDATTYQPTWIPIGRDTCLEQVILDRIAHMSLTECSRPDAEAVPPGR
jgi:hypothetical protein